MMNITLIGMAGAGKSTIGKHLARMLRYDFIDIDNLIEDKTGMRLQQIIDGMGDSEFLRIEEETALDLGQGPVDNRIIATGGSIVYCPKAMEYLRKNSVVVFLDAPLNVINRRLRDRDTRGIVGLKGREFEELFEERLALYKRYADITIHAAELNEYLADEIIERIAKIGNAWQEAQK